MLEGNANFARATKTPTAGSSEVLTAAPNLRRWTISPDPRNLSFKIVKPEFEAQIPEALYHKQRDLKKHRIPNALNPCRLNPL